jgi:Flp pilus assembly protein TadB
MTRAFYLILAPALILALVYLGLGLRPAPRALVGVVLFAGLAWFLFGRKKKPRAATK